MILTIKKGSMKSFSFAPLPNHFFSVSGKSQDLIIPSAFFTFPPLMANPDSTFASGQSFRMSRSLLPKPLPSWVQKGRIVFPAKSYSSRKVNTAIGKVPHQLG